MLDKVALFIIFAMLVMITAVIVILGSLPGKIARNRNHPWPDAVNAASWIGLATGILWPFAFVWAFLPLPVGTRRGTDDASPNEDLSTLQQRIAELEATTKALQSQTGKTSV